MRSNAWKWSGGCRLEIGNHQGLKRAMTEAPDFAFKLLGDVLKQSGSKSARKE